ncbi:biotin--[acetyl-CoA-carboxylase] ligase [Asticcacaulis excentricus]|uniref:biotin--[biotin carboxyl-carrier protein] ligase n=1 Tax=Asticcacaulis excentricus (strain ATCC 15261 / DSM 4724 / KCTC 12464 / NCIMB 9791 / VKM B-1370 / CB 48) TaxID=573065 RepID=E8RSI5_ASTEC|nr:biotin--[acetyl-CoA-carboxylase] ligase [Asticcacaulis excentricus]ADU14456.1 biotin/acetyl-CoA-carboxylase ligase [Asticcacaulis excentricus CB 48]
MALIDVFDSLPSTQTEALSRLRAGDRGPRWVRAQRQTAGQGRMGRQWDGPSGNLMASWYGVLPVEMRRVTQLSFVAALAVTDAIRPVLSAPDPLKIKWPNDVLYEGRKLCGILAQSETLETGLGVVIGIGINIAKAPQGLSYGTAALNDLTAQPQTVEVVLDALDAALTRRLDDWLTHGFEATAAQWWDQAYGRDQLCLIEQHSQARTGTILGLDDYGALRVRDPDGTIHVIASGSVSYPEA